MKSGVEIIGSVNLRLSLEISNIGCMHVTCFVPNILRDDMMVGVRKGAEWAGGQCIILLGGLGVITR